MLAACPNIDFVICKTHQNTRKIKNNLLRKLVFRQAVRVDSREDCIITQFFKGTVKKNGVAIPAAGTGGPLDGRWHPDGSVYQGDDPVFGMVPSAGVTTLVESSTIVRYMDEPGWSGLKNGDTLDWDISLQIRVYEASLDGRDIKLVRACLQNQKMRLNKY
jgi:hypothetical protein